MRTLPRRDQRFEFYENTLRERLCDIRDMSSRLDVLRQSACGLLQSFGKEDSTSLEEFTIQVQNLERYECEESTIVDLKTRLQQEQQKVHNYHKRLEKIQAKIDQQKEKEDAWRRRSSWRLRLLWGVTSILVIVWLLVTSSSEGETLVMLNVENPKGRI
ncbi:hypothetical protein EDC01DRAFT_130442 [Geopyxis carbonaria]|nr:hypothetical protein EDC01DRAFT_130442 [Geopyxis carbonaria]